MLDAISGVAGIAAIGAMEVPPVEAVLLAISVIGSVVSEAIKIADTRNDVH